MSVDRIVMAFAGLVVLISVALSHFVHPAWMWLTVFVGVNLIQSSFTGFCPAAMIFKAFGAKPGVAFK
ncbi:MAG: sulfurtransferase [Asticcacaulis sp. 32-58-5]|nr:MAG: sulfurtransferase [Asticcacaulis sp. 32-58-5]